MNMFVDYVLRNYDPKTIVLEIGAGHGSTKAFAEYFDKMYSIENNDKYCNIYHDNYIKVPLDSNGWYNSKIFNDSLPSDYSLIILDGPLGGFDHPFIKMANKIFRMGFCEHFDNIKKVDIIVDDIHRNWYERDVVQFLENNDYDCKMSEIIAPFMPNAGGFAVCKPKK